MDDFRKDAPGCLERMQTHLDSNDLEALRRLAHDLKSNSATLGILELSKAAAEIERNAEAALTQDLGRLMGICRRLLPQALRMVEDRIPAG